VRQVHVSLSPVYGNIHVLTGILSIYALQRALSGWWVVFFWTVGGGHRGAGVTKNFAGLVEL